MTTTNTTSIAIKPANAQRIDAALAYINGRAQSHTASADDILRAVKQAEEKLAALGVPVRDRAGAICHYTSGNRVAAAYKYERRLNKVLLIRNGSGWTMTEIKLWDAWPNTRTGISLALTAAQDAIAVAKLRETYAVQISQEVSS